jgi:hypothetical protein
LLVFRSHGANIGPASLGGDAGGDGPYKERAAALLRGYRMNPGWMAVTIIGVFIVVFALLNLLEKGSVD